MALIGVAGSGKTYTALSIAKHLGKRVAVLDTERGSASKYSDVFEFDVMEPETFSPQTYIDAIACRGRSRLRCVDYRQPVARLDG
jgi:DNA helicase TIP49 (TBP-interacting protein)